ncbi:MAG: hypothetical protein WBM44_11560 [Waterburya sp.]
MKMITSVKVSQLENSLEIFSESGREIDLEQILVHELNQGLVNDICNAV